MNRAWTRTAVGLLAVSALALTGCASAGPSGDAGDSVDVEELLGSDVDDLYASLPYTDLLPLDAGDASEPLTIGFSNTCYNVSWRVAMLASVQAEIARHSNVELIAVDGQCDPVIQSNSVRDLLTRGVDAIILSPMEFQALAPAAKEVTDAGIPLIVLERDVNADKSVFIAQSNEQLAYDLAKQMVSDLDGDGSIAVITGSAGASASLDRQAGLTRALEEAPGVKVLAEGDGEWTTGPAQSLMQDWLTRFGGESIDAVWTDSEDMTWGTWPAIAAADQCSADIGQYTMDGSKAAIEEVAKESVNAVGIYTPYIGDVAVRAAIILATGGKIADAKAYENPGTWLTVPNVPIVTPENADSMLASAWGDFEAPANACE